MMDKKPHIKPYLYGMLAGFGAISLSILFFFFIYRFDGFGDAVSKVTGILMPFIYGAVIAYLLKPVCNTIEGFLHRIFPEKLHSMANMLAIAATLLFGVLVVYALVMMVVPLQQRNAIGCLHRHQALVIQRGQHVLHPVLHTGAAVYKHIRLLQSHDVRGGWLPVMGLGAGRDRVGHRDLIPTDFLSKVIHGVEACHDPQRSLRCGR